MSLKLLDEEEKLAQPGMEMPAPLMNPVVKNYLQQKYMPQQTPVDEELKAAQHQSAQSQLFAGLAQAGATIGHGLSGSHQAMNTEPFQQMQANAAAPVHDLLQRRSQAVAQAKEKFEEVQRRREEERHDSNSDESKRFRETFKAFSPKIASMYTPEQFDQLTAADSHDVWDLSKHKETTEERAQATKEAQAGRQAEVAREITRDENTAKQNAAVLAMNQGDKAADNKRQDSQAYESSRHNKTQEDIERERIASSSGKLNVKAGDDEQKEIYKHVKETRKDGGHITATYLDDIDKKLRALDIKSGGTGQDGFDTKTPLKGFGGFGIQNLPNWASGALHSAGGDNMIPQEALDIEKMNTSLALMVKKAEVGLRGGPSMDKALKALSVTPGTSQEDKLQMFKILRDAVAEQQAMRESALSPGAMARYRETPGAILSENLAKIGMRQEKKASATGLRSMTKPDGSIWREKTPGGEMVEVKP